MDLRSIDASLTVASLALEVITVVRLVRLRLLRPYRWFIVFLLFDFARTAGLFYAYNGTWHHLNYARWWALSLPFFWLTLSAATFEIFTRVHASYPGEKSAPILVRWISPISAIFALLLTLIFSSQFAWAPAYLEYVRFANRALYMMALALVAGQWLFFSLLGSLLPKNLEIHRKIFVVFLGCEVLRSVFAAFSNIFLGACMNVAMIGVLCICCVAWCLLFRREGDIPPPPEAVTEQEVESARRQYELSKRLIKNLRQVISRTA